MPLEKMRAWAKALKRDVLALWLAARDPRTPWHVKIIAAAVAGYALSPIDLIPDFLPVVGYLDDVVLIPLGIVLCVKLLQPELMNEFRAKATEIRDRPVSRVAAALIVLLWIACVVGAGLWWKARS
jgi:uncharacterized membrane protein YkvA (DUF1232 family)